MRRNVQKGFSLIEALVALAILGIAATGIIRAAESHIDTLRDLERRAAAQWVAENALVQAALGLDGPREEEMLGYRWRADVRRGPSEDPDIARVIVDVREIGEEQPLVTLPGFADKGTVSR